MTLGSQPLAAFVTAVRQQAENEAHTRSEIGQPGAYTAVVGEPERDGGADKETDAAGAPARDDRDQVLQVPQRQAARADLARDPLQKSPLP